MVVERKLRRFRAAFFVTPGFGNWVRTRARELERDGKTFEIILVWGRRRFRVGKLPRDDPYFAIELPDGSVERSPWVEESPPSSSELKKRPGVGSNSSG